MTRIPTHISFMIRYFKYAIVIAGVLTVILFPWLSAGHASPVVLIFPALSLLPLIYGPALLEPGMDRRARDTAVVTSVVVFLASLGITSLVAMAARGERPELLFLILPLVQLLTSSLLLEAAYRLRARHSLPSSGDAASAGEPASPR